MNFPAAITIFFLLISFLSSCSAPLKKEHSSLPVITLDKNLNISLLPPMALDTAVSLTQSVSIDFNGQQHQFIGKLEISDHSFKMVGISHIGMKLFSIYSENNLYVLEASPTLGSQLDIEYLLADLQLIYWPVKKLNQQLQQTTASLKFDKLGRQLLNNNEPIITIRFTNNKQWNKDVTYKHLKRGYTVHIKTLAVDKL